MAPLHQNEETAEELFSPATSLESATASVDGSTWVSSLGSEIEDTGKHTSNSGSNVPRQRLTMHNPFTDPALPARHLQEDPANVIEEQDRRSALHYRDSLRKEREGHLMVLLPLSRRDSSSERQLIEFRVYVELSAFLAFKHMERRSGSVLPQLTRRLGSCDFHWTYEHHDTGFSPIQGASALLSSGFGGPTQAQPQASSFATTTATISQDSSPTPTIAMDSTPFNTSEPLVIELANTTITTTFLPGNQSNSQPDDSVTIVANDNMFDDGQGDRPIVEEGETSSAQQSSILPSTSNTSMNDTSTIEINIVNSTQMVAGASDNFDSANTIDEEPENDVPPAVDSNVRHLQETHDGNSESSAALPQSKVPFAIMGAARSLVSQTIGYLGEALDLPQISSSSTASSLDVLSLFARTVPTNNGNAHAIMAYLNRLGVEHVGILYIKDSWGKTYERDLQLYANIYNINVYSAAYVDEGDLESVMQQLKQSRIRYFFGVINPSAWKKVVRVAYQYGIMGKSDYQWYFGDLVELVGDNFVLDRETESDIADALHGTGIVLLKVKPHAAFDRAVAAFADNKMMQQEFIQSHAEPHLFDNYTFTPFPGRSLFQYLTYDAVIALGLTACETPGLFTAQEFYDQLLKIDFRGVSGQVRLDETTGTRQGDGLEYEIVNLVFDDAAHQSPFLSFDARSSLLVDLSGGLAIIQNMSTPVPPLIREDYPFIYHDSTETPPLHLPPFEEDMNLIPNGLRYVGLSLAVMIMALSTACAVFTYRYRMEFVVRASQPIFLAQICLGTFILATTIIPLSFQEEMPGLDIACALNPWFLCIGFTVTIAALFTKARRINKLTQSGTTFRRVQVQAKDVMKPFLVLLSVNVILLTAWTASPYRLSWHRKPVANLDEFGRSVESFGMCGADGGSMSLIFVIPLLLANITVMAIATYESYKGRNLPSDFSETRYLAVAMVFLCETIVLGGKSSGDYA